MTFDKFKEDFMCLWPEVHGENKDSGGEKYI